MNEFKTIGYLLYIIDGVWTPRKELLDFLQANDIPYKYQPGSGYPIVSEDDFNYIRLIFPDIQYAGLSERV